MSHHRHNYFVEQLLAWYRGNKRDLPWRKDHNAYRVWVSEIMLQQTKVDTVIPYFENFMSKFPTVSTLAEAPEEQVLKAWEGLGYYSRARNLHAAVKEVEATYGGVVPQEKEEILKLKGVGPYTAGAVLSIAYNKPEPAVDGNVMRVLSRYEKIEEDIAKVSTRKMMEKWIVNVIPHDSSGDFNQALMELGALVCTPKSPKCDTCPVFKHCIARKEGLQTLLPIKKKAKPPRPERRIVALIRGTGAHKDQVLIAKRPAEGLLANMWEFPHWEVKKTADQTSHHQDMVKLRKHIKQELGIEVQPLGWAMNVTHMFSHIHWDMDVYECTLHENDSVLDDRYHWYDPSKIEAYTFPNVFLKIGNTLLSKNESGEPE
ncbi:A/G-specific adenine glycosylase [Longirhabdus pacifica]|uniref:A/G-specific adenine glycosylase n=1 Tax=Longirhabdus pacifica TaxID=2305227 RepID=UPI0010089B21|nr:A/G-specific adenine glycosylase [Longirhabdus pacifica]